MFLLPCFFISFIFTIFYLCLQLFAALIKFYERYQFPIKSLATIDSNVDGNVVLMTTIRCYNTQKTKHKFQLLCPDVTDEHRIKPQLGNA